MKQHRKSSDGSKTEDKYQKINSLRLIHLVRGQEVLYNSDADGYNDRNVKEVAWERIYRALFPRFETLNEDIKETIGTNVRRRWKTLRNAIAREVKKNATVENYIRKKESPVIAELEFLIPHIKSAHCAKLADELGLRDCYGTVNETDEQEYDEDYNDTVDLTEELQDIKPFAFKTDRICNDVPVGSTTVVPREALYPAIQLNTSEEYSNTRADTKPSSISAWRNVDSVVAAAAAAAAVATQDTNWRNEYCSVVQCKEGEFMNSTLLCTNPESEDNHEESLNMPPQQQQQQLQPQPQRFSNHQSTLPSSIVIAAKKRPRQNGADSTNGNETTNGETVNGDSGDVQAKILRLLTNLERRDNRSEQECQDEDRMFLLSLVSDLKRVPAARKMGLKAEIAMAIARAERT